MTLLPFILWVVALFERLPSQSATDESVFTKMFIFQLVNVYMTIAVAGSLFEMLNEILEISPTKLIVLLSSNIPNVSTFFTQYVLLNALFVMPKELARPFNISRYLCWRRCCYRAGSKNTPAEEKAMSLPDGLMCSDMGWPTLYSLCCLVFIIGMTYVVMAPLAVASVVVFFLVTYFVFKYNAVYVYVTPYQNGGLWLSVFPRLMFGIGVSQVGNIRIYTAESVTFSVTCFVVTPCR